YHVRAAAVRALRYSGHQVADQKELMVKAAADEHGRVRLEAIVAASWLGQEVGLPILEEAEKHPLDDWMAPTYETALAHLHGKSVAEKRKEEIKTTLTGAQETAFRKGKEIYERDGFCSTCHQPNGRGLEASGFPPLKGTKWVLGNEDRLIKVVLNGMQGPIEVLGKKYPGQV